MNGRFSTGAGTYVISNLWSLVGHDKHAGCHEARSHKALHRKRGRHREKAVVGVFLSSISLNDQTEFILCTVRVDFFVVVKRS
jgi:hypothetical protein